MKKGWETKELAAVSAINYGYTESASSNPVGPRFLRITDIQDDCVNWDSVPYCKIESADLPKYRLASGDIVFARTGATTGKSFLVDEPPEAVFASYLIRLRLLDKSCCRSSCCCSSRPLVTGSPSKMVHLVAHKAASTRPSLALSRFPSPRSPNSRGSLASSTKRLRALPQPRPMQKEPPERPRSV